MKEADEVGALMTRGIADDEKSGEDEWLALLEEVEAENDPRPGEKAVENTLPASAQQRDIAGSEGGSADLKKGKPTKKESVQVPSESDAKALLV